MLCVSWKISKRNFNLLNAQDFHYCAVALSSLMPNAHCEEYSWFYSSALLTSIDAILDPFSRAMFGIELLKLKGDARWKTFRVKNSNPWLSRRLRLCCLDGTEFNSGGVRKDEIARCTVIHSRIPRLSDYIERRSKNVIRTHFIAQAIINHQKYAFLRSFHLKHSFMRKGVLGHVNNPI